MKPGNLLVLKASQVTLISLVWKCHCWRTWYQVAETRAFPGGSPGGSDSCQTLKATVLRERLEAKYQKKNEIQAFSNVFTFLSFVFNANYCNFCTTFETLKFSFVLPFSGRVFITMILKIIVD